jgi:hypothetical protein
MASCWYDQSLYFLILPIIPRLCDSIEFYEERQLYHLLLANDPSVRIIYLSSNQVNERVVGYYLSLCRSQSTQKSSDNEMHQMLSRIMMIHLNNPFTEHCIPLSEKILGLPPLIYFLKRLIGSSFNGCQNIDSVNVECGLSVFTGSDSIDSLSQKLGVRVLEASGDQLHYGTKQGSRECFAACGLTFPIGTPELPADEDLLSYGTDRGGTKIYWAQNHMYIRSVRDLSIGIARQIAKGVRPRKWMIKLNQGFSGKGNASIDLQSIQSKVLPVSEIAALIETELPKMKLEDQNLTWYDTDKHVGFKSQIERLGVIAESFITGEFPSSPSVQAVIEPKDGRVSVISTHEQLLDGQVYSGCINPASDKYRAKIMDAGLAVGRFLATRGVVGHFSVDFMANQNEDGSWDVHAVEVNLRQGGTTHPHSMMALLCGGSICSDGLFRTNDGSVRTYIATDTHFNSKLKGYNEERLVEAIECKTDAFANRIRWNKANGVGVTFHLFKFIKIGRIGFTAIGRTKEEAQSLFDATVEFLEDLGDKHVQGW